MAYRYVFLILSKFLNSALDDIWVALPSPIYTAFDYLLSQAYTLLCSLLTLSLTLSRSIIADTTGSPIRERIWQWWNSVDATEIVQPLVTLLAAYFALICFYRTSRWMISLIFPLIKWGVILITLGTAAGWCLANANTGFAEGANGVGRWGVAQAVSEMVDDFLDKQNQRSGAKRSRVYEPRDRRQQWRYSEARPHDQDGNYMDIQKIVDGILTGNGGWWKAVFGEDGEEESRQQRRDRRSSHPM